MTNRPTSLVVLFATLVFTLTLSAQAAGPTVDNLQSGDTLRHAVVLLKGSLPEGTSGIRIDNRDAPSHAKPVRVVTHNGRFRALVEMAPGRNRLRLATDQPASERRFLIHYKPQTNPYFVRLVWMTSSDGDPTFATPTDDTPQDYENRLRTAALLMQSFTADRMQSLGYGPRTFRLERDAAGRVVVNTWKGQRTTSQYHAMKDDRAWWSDVARWVNREHAEPLAKNMVLASYTRKDAETGQLYSHTALGGGNLGLFGSASVFSWPRSIAATVDAFHDDSRYDISRVHDDSVGRSVRWGLASTTIGASLHEMGHTFGLPHVLDSRGIMRRGFDSFNRAFTFYDPPSGRNQKPVYFADRNEAYFAPISASYLRWSCWFQLDDMRLADERPSIEISPTAGNVTIECESGVAWVGFHVGGEIVAYQEFKTTPLPTKVTLTREEIDAELKGGKLNLIRALSAGGIETSRRL